MIPEKANLPPELLELKQFILWFEEMKGEKLFKIPSAPWKTGHWKAASATDPNNWTGFDEALSFASQKEGYGIGFAFKEGGGIVGIDLDKCVENDKINKFASDVIHRANSYTELSPSMKGVHIFMRGDIIDKVVKDEKIEIYNKERYFTLTGKRYVDTPCVLNRNDDLLEELYGKYCVPPPIAIVAKNIDEDIPIAAFFDVSKLKRRGKQLQGPHPIHGSETGMNFSINEEKNVWYCYRHRTGGGPLALLGLLRGIVNCEDCVPGRIRGDKFRAIIETGREEKLISDDMFDEMKGITDKFITDSILEKHKFYCDKHDPNLAMYVWNEGKWHNGMSEGIVLNELSKMFFDEPERGKMGLEKTVNFIKGMAMETPVQKKTPNLVSFRNGLLDVVDMSLKPHDPNIFCVNQIPHDYDPDTKSPRWEQWLSEVIHAEDMDFLQEWMGCNLYDSYPEQGFLILIGSGQNGKTIFMDIFTEVLGEENVTNISLVDLTYDTFSRAELYHKLANISDDIGSGVIRNSGKLKEAASGSRMNAQRKFGQPFDFNPYAKITYSCNEPPEIQDQSDALKHRMYAVEFPNIFTKAPVNDEKEAKDRKELMVELRGEIPGIINWMLAGLKRFLANNCRFSASKSRDETWTFYRRRSNPVLAFMEERLEMTDDDDDKLTVEQMYSAFSAWRKECGIKLKVSRDKMLKALKAEGVETRQRREDDRKRHYYGVKCHAVTPYLPTPLFKNGEKGENEKGERKKREKRGGEYRGCDRDTVTGEIPRQLTQHDKACIVYALIAELEDQYGGIAPVDEVYSISVGKGVDKAFLDVFVNEEKRRGHLYEPKLGCLSRAVKTVPERKEPPA